MSKPQRIVWTRVEVTGGSDQRIDWVGKSGGCTVFFIYDYTATGSFFQSPITLNAFIRWPLENCIFATMDDAKEYAEAKLEEYVTALGAMFPVGAFSDQVAALPAEWVQSMGEVPRPDEDNELAYTMAKQGYEEAVDDVLRIIGAPGLHE
jgi:hypothetical protein